MKKILLSMFFSSTIICSLKSSEAETYIFFDTTSPRRFTNEIRNQVRAWIDTAKKLDKKSYAALMLCIKAKKTVGEEEEIIQFQSSEARRLELEAPKYIPLAERLSKIDTSMIKSEREYEQKVCSLSGDTGNVIKSLESIINSIARDRQYFIQQIWGLVIVSNPHYTTDENRQYFNSIVRGY